MKNYALMKLISENCADFFCYTPSSFCLFSQIQNGIRSELEIVETVQNRTFDAFLYQVLAQTFDATLCLLMAELTTIQFHGKQKRQRFQ